MRLEMTGMQAQKDHLGREMEKATSATLQKGKAETEL